MTQTGPMDGPIVKVRPDEAGARKNGPQAIGKSRGGGTAGIDLIAADVRTAAAFRPSPGEPWRARGDMGCPIIREAGKGFPVVEDI